MAAESGADAGGPALGVARPEVEQQCRERCVPGKLIFLPCMAVGAKGMLACREREVEQCREACVRRQR